MEADFDLDRHTLRVSLAFKRAFVYHFTVATLVLNIQGNVQITRTTPTPKS